MKRTLVKCMRSGLAMLLVFCMVFSYAGTALAAGVNNDAGDRVYVALGDSMTNGYGLDGYEYEHHAESTEECTDPACAEEHYVWHWANGYLQEAPQAYPSIVADHFGWDLIQLGMSAMRAEDLHWLLELDYTDRYQMSVAQGQWDEAKWNDTFGVGDYYTWNEFATGRLKDNRAYPGANLADIAKKYQDSVANADIISLSIGNSNFGVFMLGRIMESIGFGGTPDEAMIYALENAIRECDPELQENILKVREQIVAELDKVLAEQGIDPESELFAALKNTFEYATVSYVLNYAGTLEAILKLNPDAEIMLVGLMNTMNGMELTAPGMEGTIDMADILGVLIDPLNVYIAALPTAMQLAQNETYVNATFYYAEAPKVECMVDTYEDTIANDVVRDRFITEIVGSCDCAVPCYDAMDCPTWEPGMVWGMMDMPPVSGLVIEEVTALTADDEALSAFLLAMLAGNTNSQAISMLGLSQIYRGFEQAVIAASKDSVIDVNSILALSDPAALSAILQDVMANVLSEEGVQIALSYADRVSNIFVGAFGVAVKPVTEGIVAGKSASEIVAGLTETQAIALNLVAASQNMTVADLIDMVAENMELLCLVLALPEMLSTAAQDNNTLMGLLHLFARCIIGNGLGAHPSAAGHAELAEAIINAYETKHTAADETIDNIIAGATFAVEQLDKFLEENGYYEDAEAALAAALVELKIAADKLDAELSVKAAELYAELEVLYKELMEEKADLESAIEAKIEAAIAEIEATIAEIEAKIAQAKAELEAFLINLYITTFYAEYDLNGDSYFVALGDANAYGVSADLVADALSAMLGKEIGYSNLTKAGLTADALLANLSTYADLAKADLITVGFSANAFLDYAAEQVKKAQTVELPAEIDWSLYLGEEGAAELGAALDELYAQLLANEVPAIASAVILAVESYVYSYVTYMTTYAAVIEGIYAINPDAAVLMVSMSNPFDGVVLSVGDAKIDLGTYLQKLVEVTNLYTASYALVSTDAVYVEASEAENAGDGIYTAEQFLSQILFYGTVAFNPTEAGYTYIAEQILGSLIINIDAVPGDVNGDGEIDNIDAMLILQYTVEIISEDDLNVAAADVNGDGVVDNIDAMLVLQYTVEIIDKFPVSK